MINKKIISKLILERIEQEHGHCSWNFIKAKVSAHFFSLKQLIPPDREIVHIAYLLERDDAVERIVEGVGIYYRITPWGHALLGPFYKKWGYFLVYKKTNLISLLALILSLIAILLSDRIWGFLFK